ncbi:SPOR domain-containing protein [Desertivirga xinjiangensis]|uniref:SPOR domain-containing protein n=1 Tax=Desertivirga xinjiangensis TaxID=539206 RepID=UPI00210AA4CC|nr:SPOR domain-containing protein [Pedobacter xinjiangensis]
MDVGLYVSELLDELNEVSLPGIGTFSKKRTPAFFDKNQDLFFPPAEEVVFEDGDAEVSAGLIKLICREKNISEPSARYFTEKYTDSIKQSLQIKGFAQIGPIGKIRSGENGIIFESESIAATNGHAFGLRPVKEIRPYKTADKVIPEEVKRDEITPEQVILQDIAAAEPEVVPVPQKASPGTLDSNTHSGVNTYTDTDTRSYKTGIIIVLILLIAAAIVVGSYFYYPQVFNQIRRSDSVAVPVKKQLRVAAPVTLKDSIAKADSIMEKNFEELNDEAISVEKSRDTIDISTKVTPIPQDTLQPVPGVRYEIICAAFHRRSEAEEFVRITRQKGIDARIVVDERKPKYKISLASFKDNEAAQKERRRIQEKIAKDAWILTIKNK